MDEPTQKDLKALFLTRLEEELRALREASEQTAADRRPVELDQHA